MGYYSKAKKKYTSVKKSETAQLLSDARRLANAQYSKYKAYRRNKTLQRAETVKRILASNLPEHIKMAEIEKLRYLHSPSRKFIRAKGLATRIKGGIK